MSLQLVVNVAKTLTLVLTVGAILAELVMHLTGRRRDYRFSDTVANICTAVVYGALGGLAIACILPVYEALRTHFALFAIEPTNPLAWILGFICADFCHYWFHRAAHRNNFLWGIHQGHHSSEDFNLSIAVRKGIFQQWVDWPFFLPMALAGFPFFEMYLPLKGAQFAYQFWIHNQFIGKLGPIEQVMVTPSLHRVHHGQNPQYMDKNYAGVFILWDRLFGSYAQEHEPVVYGISTPVRTFNPMRMQFTYWINLWRDACASTLKWDRIRIWFMPTGWRPANRHDAPWPDKIKDVHSFEKYDRRVDARTKVYVVVQLAVMTLLLMRMGDTGTDVITLVSNGVALAFVLWTAWSVGLFLDQQARVQPLEIARLALLAIYAAAAIAMQSGAARITAEALLAAALASMTSLGFLGAQREPAMETP